MELRYLLALTLSFLAFGCGAKVLNSPSETAASPALEEPKTQLVKAEEQTVIKSGSFIAGEHPTEGTVHITSKSGKQVLELDQAFKTFDMGPDLVVILHRAGNVLESTKPPSYPLQAGDYVILAPLQKFRGVQNYPIPEDINLEDYKSAVIWCRKFNATFGTATLNDTGSVSAQ